MDIWTTTLALAGLVVLSAIVAGVLGNGPARPRPSLARRLAIALAMAVTMAGAVAIAAIWLLRLLD